MNFKGIITAVMPVVSGIGKNGKEWRRASYVLTYDNSKPEYPKSVLFDVIGDKIEQLNIKQGVEYEVEIDFTTREYNGRTYMSASAWKAIPTQPTAQPAAQQPVYQQPQAQTSPVPQSDDLPF